jgi:hypothetical protein
MVSGTLVSRLLDAADLLIGTEQFNEQARTVVEEITALSAHDRRTLATHLLFKSRP